MPLIAKDVWITREGQEISITHMASSHLLSTIHFIERNRFNSATDVYGLSDEMPRGERLKAINYYMQWPIQYDNLIAEAVRRGLINRQVEGLVKARKK